MKKEQKNAFDIKLEKETRKQLIKYITPIAVIILLLFLLLCAWGGAMSKQGIVGFIASQVPLSIVCIVLYILLIPFMWFMSKSDFRRRAYEKLLKDISKSLVERMMTPGEPIRVILTKSKCDFGDFVLGLQEDEKVELYAVLERNHNLIGVYGILTGETKRRDFDVVTKEEFADFYQFVYDSENS